MIIDCISDLHGFYPVLTGGDLLIVAGDLTAKDMEKENDNFWRWLCYQNYKKIIVIGGNHDNFLQKNPDSLKDEGNTLCYLCDSGTEFEGLKVWGSPWTKTFLGMNRECKAFTVDTDDQLKEKFDLIPDDIDILITHSPPYGIMDQVVRGGEQINVGSFSLRCKIELIQPRLHVFGHIHSGHGNTILKSQMKEPPKNIICVNASIMDEVYDPINKHIRIIL